MANYDTILWMAFKQMTRKTSSAENFMSMLTPELKRWFVARRQEQVFDNQSVGIPANDAAYGVCAKAKVTKTKVAKSSTRPAQRRRPRSDRRLNY
jgi:hypothetical protein